LLSQRVGLDTTTDPPFFAYLVLTDSEVETGFGLSFCIPEDSGDVLEVYASMQARFVFKNPKAWYIHVGTREKPNTGSLFNLLRVESFLMLSAAGIDMGAKAELSFSRSYLGGMLAADVYAYMECGGKISFERFQIAAFMATGGHVDVSVFKLGFYCGFDTTLSVEVPKPFTIEGSVSLAVGFRIFGKKIVCEFTVEFRWERSKNLIVPYISPLLGEAVELPVKAVSMLSQELFDISPLKENEGIQKINKLIPCDSYIDIEFVKPVNPKAVMDTVGGVGELDSTYEEIIPPKPIKKQATHSYSLENITIQYWDSDKWQPYHPYEAMSTPVQQGSDPIDFYSGELKLIGQWQMQSRGEYQRIRLLSQSVFSYMDKGLKGWVKPEEYGITAGSLFCANAELQNQRANWTAYALDTKVQSETLISKQDATQIVSCCITGERAHVGYVSNPYSLSKSLLFRNDSQCVIFLQESCAFVRLKLFTYSEYVTITYYKRNVTSITKIAEEIKTRYELLNPVDYENELQPVDILVIRPSFVDAALIQSKLREIEALCESVYESGEMKPAIRVLIQQLIEALEAMFQQSQAGSQLNRAAIEEQHYNLLQKYNRLLEELNAVRTQIARYEELLRVASQKMNSCCTVLHPTGEKTEKDVCIENLETIVPEGVSTQGIEGEYLRFIDNLRRLAQGLAQCKQNYTTNIDALCASSQEYITRLTKLLATSRETESTLVKQIEKTLEDGNRINTMLQGSPGDITVEPYGGYGDDCTVLHEIEWQSLREWQLNSNSPKQDAVAKSYKDSVQAIEHSLSPIWRPNTTFRVCITAKDEVKNRVGYETVDKKNAKEFKYYFGFKTGGPVGYFHKDYNATKTKEIDKYCPDGETNLLKYRLTTLRDYIDYERSYPNASGNLLQAKPLYYENTKLNLFYVHSYVYHLLNDWKKLGKLPAITGTLEVVVKDPLEDFEIPNPPPPDIETQYMPQSIVGWQPDTTPRVSKGVRITDILRNPELYNPDFIDIYGNRCWKAGAFPIKPASLKTVVTLNFLRPQTLYTALFYNVFGKERREVHRYVFQTSRYASMQEQFDSYVQTDAYGNVGRALYTIDVSLDGVKLQRLNTLLQTGKTGNSVIDSRFSNAFDSLIEGVLELGPQQPAETTEVSIVRNTHPTTGVVTILGLIVRSPEPMINPALPQEIKNLYCKPFQIDFPRNRTQSYAFAHSKDCSQFFVTHATENQLTSSELRLTFTSYAWDGKAYSPERDDTNTIISCSLNVSLIN
ncbi:MAG: hypothetical protein FWC39_12605, partial [Bacteroidetes bacterium]|nr:hypothetical protein [Bacteroidota bacterium]